MRGEHSLRGMWLWAKQRQRQLLNHPYITLDVFPDFPIITPNMFGSLLVVVPILVVLVIILEGLLRVGMAETESA